LHADGGQRHRLLRREPGVTAATTRIAAVPTASIACALDGPDRAARQAEWAALRAPARIAEDRTPTTLTTTWRRDHRVQREIERLVAAEHECCPFFGFELTIRDDTVTLVTAFPEGLSPASWEW
jgi:hypothetical protein